MTRGREDLVLTAGFAGATAAVVLMCAGLSPVARRAPLIVAIPTLLLLLFDLGFQVAGTRAGRRLRTWRLPGVGAYLAAGQAKGQDRADDLPNQGRRELVLLGWAFAALALSYGAGMSAGLTLFVMLYLRLQAGQRWPAAAAVGVGTWLVLQGVLVSVLGVRLFEGVWSSRVTWPW